MKQPLGSWHLQSGSRIREFRNITELQVLLRIDFMTIWVVLSGEGPLDRIMEMVLDIMAKHKECRLVKGPKKCARLQRDSNPEFKDSKGELDTWKR
ncbi:MAG: hypothetical protein ACOX0E_09635 [Syntrophomonadaceae bacterium]